MKLNELSPRPGSAKKRMRVGRGPGSGKGKTAGRGVKGQNSRSGVANAGFEGGQMPLHMRMPKRGFRNPFAKKLVEVNLWRLAQAIDAGKLDIAQPIDAAALIAAGVIRRERDGVRLLGEGAVALKGKLDLRIHSATASAKKAIEDAGGKLTLSLDADNEKAAKKIADKAAADAAKGKTPKGPRGKNINRVAAAEAKANAPAKPAKAPKGEAAAAPAAPEA